MKPPCSTWKVWVGQEIEGTKGIGEFTLFIRSLYELKVEDKASFAEELHRLAFTKFNCTRVWFCKEFTDWEMLELIAKHFKEACVESLPMTYQNIPLRIRRGNYLIYVKVDLELKSGDFVCVGPAFSDEAFEIGTGAKVTPKMYLADRKIL